MFSRNLEILQIASDSAFTQSGPLQLLHHTPPHTPRGIPLHLQLQVHELVSALRCLLVEAGRELLQELIQAHLPASALFDHLVFLQEQKWGFALAQSLGFIQPFISLFELSCFGQAYLPQLSPSTPELMAQFARTSPFALRLRLPYPVLLERAALSLQSE